MTARQPTWMRTCQFAAGCALVLVSPLVGIIPGPGGLVVFAIGVALMLRGSPWAKRRYVGAKRRWPRMGDWVDWGLRRPSAQRRRATVAAVRHD